MFICHLKYLVAGDNLFVCCGKTATQTLLPCSAVRLSAVQCLAVQCSVVLYSTVQRSIVQCSAVHCEYWEWTVLYSIYWQCNIVLWSAQYSGYYAWDINYVVLIKLMHCLPLWTIFQNKTIYKLIISLYELLKDFSYQYLRSCPVENKLECTIVHVNRINANNPQAKFNPFSTNNEHRSSLMKNLLLPYLTKLLYLLIFSSSTLPLLILGLMNQMKIH